MCASERALTLQKSRAPLVGDTLDVEDQEENRLTISHLNLLMLCRAAVRGSERDVVFHSLPDVFVGATDEPTEGSISRKGGLQCRVHARSCLSRPAPPRLEARGTSPPHNVIPAKAGTHVTPQHRCAVTHAAMAPLAWMAASAAMTLGADRHQLPLSDEPLRGYRSSGAIPRPPRN